MSTRRRLARATDVRRQIAWRREASEHEIKRGRHKGFWPLYLRLSGRPPAQSAGDFAAILLVHERPATLDLQVRIALHTPSIGMVHISNNNPAVDVAEYLTIASRRVVVHEEFDWNQTRRYLLAGDLRDQRFVSLDDDIYLDPRHLEQLLGQFRREDAVPTGVTGQNRIADGWINEVVEEGPVDILNRLYVFSAEHVRRFHVLLDELGWSSDQRRTNFADDVLISATGDGPARIVPTPWIDCTSHNRKEISTFRRTGFHDPRGPWLEQAREIQLRRGWAASRD
ncbi:MAG: hypothetical protein R3249_00230 [Nitriliruptorales bacterium]|nr:hypothetical protein [Nitriliruptorales bacterium]